MNDMKRVTVCLSAHFTHTLDGAVYNNTGLCAGFFQRYLSVYDSVTVVGRSRLVAEPCAASKQVTSRQIRFIALPYYKGPLEFAMNYYASNRVLDHELDVQQGGSYILRMSSEAGNLVWRRLCKCKIPYALEVVVDPGETLSRQGVSHILRPYFRYRAVKLLSEQCKGAAAVAYVTERSLQLRYPTSAPRWSIPTAQLDSEAYSLPRKRINDYEGRRFVLSVAASLDQPYKGIHVLIAAAARLAQQGFDIEVRIAGRGRLRQSLHNLAMKAGVGERVRFVGYLETPDKVRAFLDESDLFVIPSLTEGLPRALVEAMARSLPCVGTAVGGIPELLDSADLVPRNDSSALASAISRFVVSRRRREEASKRNYCRACAFSKEIIEAKRVDFYRFVKECT